jgi:uncharacterized protein (DUF433 family)
MNALLERIAIDPKVCSGKPCIKATRIWVSLILDLQASGMAEAELLTECLQLVHDDILAAIANGAEAAREQIVPVPIGQVAKFKRDENIGMRRSSSGLALAGDN